MARLPDDLKVVLGAVLAVILPVGLCFAWIAFQAAYRPTSTWFGGVLYLVGPFIGFGFIAHPFGSWRDFEPETVRLCVFMTVAYWIAYAPMFYLLMMIRLIGAAGGIYGHQRFAR